MASITQTRFDKENSNDVLLSSKKSNQLASSFKQKCSVNSTPINMKIDNNRPELSSTVKRKALGDLFNTTKANKKLFQNFMTPTKNPNVMGILNSYSAKKVSNIESCENSKEKVVTPNVDDNERFIPPPIDTFSDLFENGKISELLMGKKIIFTPMLPCATSLIVSENTRLLGNLNSYDENEWNEQLNKWKDSLTNEIQMETREMPCIDELAFKMPDNFDLI